MQLEGKIAVIYGARGAIGGAVARAFAPEGARIILAGQSPASLDVVASATLMHTPEPARLGAPLVGGMGRYGGFQPQSVG